MMKIIFTILVFPALLKADAPKCSDLLVHLPDNYCTDYLMEIGFSKLNDNRWYVAMLPHKLNDYMFTLVTVTEVSDDSDVARLQESEKILSEINEELILKPDSRFRADNWYIRTYLMQGLSISEGSIGDGSNLWDPDPIKLRFTKNLINFVEYLHQKKYQAPKISDGDFFVHRQENGDSKYMFHAAEKIIKIGSPFDAAIDWKFLDPARFDPNFSKPFEPADDIYKIGSVIATLGTKNYNLFPEQTQEELKLAVQKGDFILPRDLPLEMAVLVHWALLADREKRINIQEMSALIKELENIKWKIPKKSITLNNKQPVPNEILDEINPQFKSIYLNMLEARIDLGNHENSPQNKKVSSFFIYSVGGAVLGIILLILIFWFICGRNYGKEVADLENQNQIPLTTQNDVSAMTTSGAKNAGQTLETVKE